MRRVLLFLATGALFTEFSSPARAAPQGCDVVMADDEITLVFGGTVNIDVTANDGGYDPNTSNPIIVTGPQLGGAFEGPSGSGEIIFSSSFKLGDCGTTSMTYRLIGTGDCAGWESEDAVVEITVLPQNGDCNGNCLADTAEGATDCDGDGIATDCDGSEDCNGNGLPDCHDLATTSLDANGNGVPDECELEPVIYCGSTGGPGCASYIAHTGTPSFASSNLRVFALNLQHPSFGLMFWSLAPQQTPLFGGTLCLAPPHNRTPPRPTFLHGMGTTCTGGLAFQWQSGALAAAGLLPGTMLFCQYLARDVGAPQDINLSNALQFVVLP